MTRRTFPLIVLPLALLAAPSPGRAATGTGGGADGLTLSADGRTAGSVSPATFAGLPRQAVTLPADPGRGSPARRYEGPTLWSVLERAGLAGDARDAVRRVVVLRGRDGYGAAIAEGEIAPAFENKTVILADTADGRKLGTDHLRLVVPGDGKGGRSVRDVVSAEVDTVAPAKPDGMRPQDAGPQKAGPR